MRAVISTWLETKQTQPIGTHSSRPRKSHRYYLEMSHSSWSEPEGGYHHWLSGCFSRPESLPNPNSEGTQRKVEINGAGSQSRATYKVELFWQPQTTSQSQ